MSAPPVLRVLGIDPGTHVCGYGVVESRGPELKCIDFGVIRARRGMELAMRLKVVYDGLQSIFARHEPHAGVVEGAFYGKNARTALVIGQARGIALLAVAEAGVELAEYPPATVKKAVVGAGGAGKDQVQQMVRVLLGLSELPEPQDASDALALAICHCRRAHWDETVSRAP